MSHEPCSTHNITAHFNTPSRDVVSPGIKREELANVQPLDCNGCVSTDKLSLTPMHSEPGWGRAGSKGDGKASETKSRRGRGLGTRQVTGAIGTRMQMHVENKGGVMN